MKKLEYIVRIVTLMVIFNSCIGDLNVTPIDKNVISGNPGEEAMIQTLAKLYASFAVPGQGKPGDHVDISGIDPGFGTYTRALWNMQQLTTDEAICAWNDQTIKDMHWHTWSATDVFNSAMYSRIIYTVTICNEFIRNIPEEANEKAVQYKSEARFLRALAYSHGLDLYGKPAFITEADGIGSFFPKQAKSRKALFEYIEGELKDLVGNLPDHSAEIYPRATKPAAWMLLAWLYLNAEVWTGDDVKTANGTKMYGECITYADKVIDEGGYQLDNDYRRMFSADNHTSPEIIYAIAYDGINTQAHAGSTFIIHSAVGNGGEGQGVTPADQGTTGGWAGNRAVKEFVEKLVDKPWGDWNYNDILFENYDDTRIWLSLMGKPDIDEVGTFTEGIQVRKFTNKKSDGSQADNYHAEFSSTDIPVFRLADAYLMRAEAKFRNGGNGSDDINTLRDKRVDNHEDATYTLDDILDERARELYWECTRRTDLIRFNKFTSGDYLWEWKGNVKEGKASEAWRRVFPIPASEVASNPNIVQNEGY